MPEFVYEENNYTIQVNVKSLTNNANLTIYDTGAKVVLQKALSVGNNVFSIENSDIMLVQFDITNDTVLEIEYIKLEQGSIATPLVPRPYGEELALCQRYFDMITSIRAIGVESNTGTKRFMYSIPRTSVMRTAPTITIGGNTSENSTSGICVRECENCVMYTGLSFSYEARPRELLIAVNFAGSLPNKKPNETQIYISDNFYIYLDAEIY